MIWLKFLAAAGIIIACGTVLAVYADRLSEKLDISGALIGLILLSVVTSLPEFGATVSAVVYVGKPDLAAGNIFGSNTFNILILSIIDFILGATSIYTLSKVSHARSAALAILMTVIAMSAIALGDNSVIAGRVGVEAFILLAVYFGGIYLIFKKEEQSPHPKKDGLKESVAFEAAVVAASAVVVVVTSYWLALISDEIAVITGWGESFVGYLFLAVSTSLPELVVSITAIRLKAYDMAIANIFGSCFFNIIIFSVADFLYPSPVLRNVDPANIKLAFISAVMIGVAMAALAAGKRGMKTGFVKWALAALYLLGSWVVFSPGG